MMESFAYGVLFGAGVANIMGLGGRLLGAWSLSVGVAALTFKAVQ